MVWLVTGAMLATAVTLMFANAWRVDALPGASESTVVAVEPTRVLDTRFNVGLTGAFQHGVSRKLTVTGSIATYFEPTDTREDKIVVPVGATGVVLNATAVGPTGGGFVSVRPGDATGFPSTSNINIVPGQTVPNAVTVAVPTAGTGVGQIDITYGSTAGNTVNIIVDIVGYTANTGLIDLTNRVIAAEAKIAASEGEIASDTATVPSGVTITGYDGWDHAVIEENARVRFFVQLPVRAPAVLLSENVNFAPTNAATDDDPTCTGNVDAPTAPPGKVCIYVASANRIDGAQGQETTPPTSSTFQVRFDTAGATLGDDMYIWIAWAYTAP